jgi:hypothetical protein
MGDPRRSVTTPSRERLRDFLEVEAEAGTDPTDLARLLQQSAGKLQSTGYDDAIDHCDLPTPDEVAGDPLRED